MFPWAKYSEQCWKQTGADVEEDHAQDVWLYKNYNNINDLFMF